MEACVNCNKVIHEQLVYWCMADAFCSELCASEEEEKIETTFKRTVEVKLLVVISDETYFPEKHSPSGPERSHIWRNIDPDEHENCYDEIRVRNILSEALDSIHGLETVSISATHLFSYGGKK